MEVGISFTIYTDFSKYIKFDCDYTEALIKLNEIVNDFIKKNKLTFLYKNRKVNIKTPIQLNHTGNIFEDCWESVDIYCDVDINPKDFDSNKLRVGKCPDIFEPKCVLW